MTWIITANATSCRIYQYHHKSPHLTLLKELEHPENRLKKSEYLTSDKSGRYKTDHAIGSSYEPPMDPKEVQVDTFSRDIARELNQGRSTNAYKQLIIVMPPHMQGLLYKHLDDHVKNLIKDKIQKDIMNLSQQDLMKFLENDPELRSPLTFR